MHQQFLSGVGTPDIDGTYNINVSRDKLGAGFDSSKFLKKIVNGVDTATKVYNNPLSRNVFDYGVKAITGGNLLYNHNKLILP